MASTEVLEKTKIINRDSKTGPTSKHRSPKTDPDNSWQLS